MENRHSDHNSFDSEHMFDLDSGLVSVEYGVSIIKSHEEIGHWSDLVPHITIPGF
jgi:hypothetical protein